MYCQQVGIASDPAAFVGNAKAWLTGTIRSVDAAFPQNEAVAIVSGEPVVRKLEKLSLPEGFALIDRLLAERLPECNIVDILTDTEHWLHWTKPFGPLSGHTAKIEDPRARYVVTAFCYGCNLGPTQTARCLGGLERRDTAYLNQCHVTEERLLDAGTRIINAYNRFALPKLWGSGKSASADGTKWDVYEQNLLSEYHIRYGGWGGIGYYHVSESENAEIITQMTPEKNAVHTKEPEPLVHRGIAKIKHHIRSRFTAEGFIGDEDMALFRSAKYSNQEIKWIAKVKTASKKAREENVKSTPPGARDLYAYDLVKVHAMIARDKNKWKNNFISPQTEKFLDTILDFINDRQTLYYRRGQKATLCVLFRILWV